MKGFANRFSYGTTKAAVIGLTKSVAADNVARGIRCNCIAPGTVEQPSLHDRMREMGDIDAARKMFVGRQPMGRLATAEEIVPIVVYLASDESSFATGQVFAVDGGITIRATPTRRTFDETRRRDGKPGQGETRPDRRRRACCATFGRWCADIGPEQLAPDGRPLAKLRS
jgi:hypothetical protein